MPMTEIDLYGQCARHFKGVKTRIENSIVFGLFDLNYLHRGHETWVELKVVKAKTGKVIEVRTSQYIWGVPRIKEGATNLYFLVGWEYWPYPKLYEAGLIFSKCSPRHVTSRGLFKVPLEGLLPVVEGDWGVLDDHLSRY